MAAVVAAVVCLRCAPNSQADDVALYLERHGLRDLLAIHLEERLEEATADERGAIAARLAALYAELLEAAVGTEERIDLEQRSRRLLEIIPEEGADELRLALLRGRYSAAERIAENYRLRLSDDAQVAEAQSILDEAIPEFNALRTELDRKVEAAERRLDRSDPALPEQVRLSDNAERLRRMRAQAFFLSAWALYYQGWLRGTDESSRIAEGLFAEILTPDLERFRWEEVSSDLLEVEVFARCTLGMSLCRSLAGRLDEALYGIDLLENEPTFEPLRAQAPAWRLAVLLENGDFDSARQVLGERRESGEAAPIVWVRLAAVHALEAAARSASAATLAREALADLAARGELSQILDLTDRYGLESLGTSGFAPLYVRGARQYQEARALHGDEHPTARADVIAKYAGAAAALTEATAQTDAQRFRDAAAGARFLIGWCRYFSGDFLGARAAFEAASAELGPAEAPEASWMAIVSLDHIVSADPASLLAADIETLIDRFLQRYPSNEYAPRLVLLRAERSAEPASLQVAEELLSITPTSAAFDAAQRRAEQMLYELFLNAAGARRVELAGRYLAVALPLWSRADAATALADESLAEPFVVRARRILEAALWPGVDRRRVAEETLARLKAEAGEAGMDLAEVADELDFRRIQIALLAGDDGALWTLAERMRGDQPGSMWTAAAARVAFRHAVDAWRAGGAGARPAIERIVRYGAWIIEDFESQRASLEDSAVLAFYSTTAEAAMELWRADQTPEMGRRALFLYKRLHEFHANSAPFLRAVGILAGAFDEPELALECWRRLGAGLEPGSEPWFEARFHQIELLAAADAPLAREVFDQVKALYPELGPEPWKRKLLEIEARLPAASQGADAPGGGL